MREVIYALRAEVREGNLGAKEVIDTIERLYPDETVLRDAVHKLTSGQVPPSAPLRRQIDEAVRYLSRDLDEEWSDNSEIYSELLDVLCESIKEEEC